LVAIVLGNSADIPQASELKPWRGGFRSSRVFVTGVLPEGGFFKTSSRAEGRSRSSEMPAMKKGLSGKSIRALRFAPTTGAANKCTSIMSSLVVYETA